MATQRFELPLEKKYKASVDAYSFIFDRRGIEFDFLPGQYIRLILPHENPDERGTSRFFSVNSSPTEKEILMITTRILQSSYKKTFASLSLGYKAQFMGPFGDFVLHPDETRDVVLIAGGIGVTPYRSMLIYARDNNLQLPITLLVSYSRAEDILFHDEFNSIAQTHKNITYIPTITKPKESGETWNREIGRLDPSKLEKYIANPKDSLYYIVGSQVFVVAMRELVESLGIQEDALKTEDFPGY